MNEFARNKQVNEIVYKQKKALKDLKNFLNIILRK